MSSSRESESVMNVSEALAYTAGDMQMLKSMAELLLEEGPVQMQAIESHVRSGDLEGIRKSAHTLKGSIVIFAARAALDAALRLEQVASSGQTAPIDDAWATLNREMNRLFESVKRLCENAAQ